jgi:predicted nuclease of predicted toxin-antitoxin system
VARPKFLLDEHISCRVAEEAMKRGFDVRAVESSELAGSDDLSLFRVAIRDGRIMVTYDNGDFASLFTDLLKEGAEIPGIVFVDIDTIPTSDISGLARALVRLAERIEAGEVDPSGGIFLGRS